MSEDIDRQSGARGVGASAGTFAMKRRAGLSRRRFLASVLGTAGAAVLSGCDAMSGSDWFPKVLRSGEKLTEAAQRVIAPRRALAQEFTEADLSPHFRSNGTAMPRNPEYMALASGGFNEYRLEVGGLVEKPASFSLAELRALPSRTQITRHDCVEGWSAIGKWKGARLAALLGLVQPKPSARFVMFHCADPKEAADRSSLYYESIDMDDALHEQTILAYELNEVPLPIPNGAPVRLRVERQIGYKHAKYVMQIELVAGFGQIRGGRGGYWEDQGYQWWAGI